MNRRYRFHPGLYELGENEKFYGGMEARGWRLVKRGGYLSRFERAEPSRARYRVEVVSPGFLEEPGPPEGLLAVFEECGWTYVCGQSFLHIFRAPEGSGAPEFYADPAQQAETLKKLRRSQWLGLAVIALTLAGLAALAVWKPFGDWYPQAVKRFVLAPTVYAFYLFWGLWAIYRALWDTWKISRTYARLKKGRPLDHNPKGSRALHRILNRGLPLLAILSVLGTAGLLLTSRSDDLPLAADGPYLLLSDLGWEGERGTLFYKDNESSITRSRALLADYWDVREFLDVSPGRQAILYQDVYRLRLPALADALAWALMEDSVFAREADAFYEVPAPGLDKAWTTGGLELAAVKGNLVIYIEYLDDVTQPLDVQGLLEALAARWAEYG